MTPTTRKPRRTKKKAAPVAEKPSAGHATHEWGDWLGQESGPPIGRQCANCGMIERRDKQNGPCKGDIVKLRKPEKPVAAPMSDARLEYWRYDYDSDEAATGVNECITEIDRLRGELAFTQGKFNGAYAEAIKMAESNVRLGQHGVAMRQAAIGFAWEVLRRVGTEHIDDSCKLTGTFDDCASATAREAAEFLAAHGELEHVGGRTWRRVEPAADRKAERKVERKVEQAVTEADRKAGISE